MSIGEGVPHEKSNKEGVTVNKVQATPEPESTLSYQDQTVRTLLSLPLIMVVATSGVCQLVPE